MAFMILTPDEMRRAEEHAVNNFKIPSLVLMENAGKGLAEEIIKRFGPSLKEKKIGVFCGKGNNGGDGIVASIYLFQHTKNIKIFLLAKEDEFKGDALIQLERAKEKGITIEDACNFISNPEDFDIYIDAIFGTGFKGGLEGKFLEIIKILNEKGGFKVACDIPSGVDGESGDVVSEAFKAHLTCTFAFPKRGLVVYPGKHYAGELKVIDIGIETNFDSKLYLLESSDIKSSLPTYFGNEHKGTCGKILVIAGSKEYTGAPYFTCEGAVNAGAGLCFLAVPEEIRPIMQSKLNEAIILSYSDLDDLRKILERDYDVIIFGPGLGRTEKTLNILKEIVSLKAPKVIDADGIWALSKIGPITLENAIITPHPGEASFLLNGIDAGTIDKKRLIYAKEIAEKWGAVTVLKGALTVISNGDTIYVNPTGNPGMAVGGMGDVLTGILGALFPRMKDPLKTALAGVYIHGLSADLLLETETYETVTPTKVIQNLGKAFKFLKS